MEDAAAAPATADDMLVDAPAVINAQARAARRPRDVQLLRPRDAYI